MGKSAVVIAIGLICLLGIEATNGLLPIAGLDFNFCSHLLFAQDESSLGGESNQQQQQQESRLSKEILDKLKDHSAKIEADFDTIEAYFRRMVIGDPLWRFYREDLVRRVAKMRTMLSQIETEIVPLYWAVPVDQLRARLDYQRALLHQLAPAREALDQVEQVVAKFGRHQSESKPPPTMGYHEPVNYTAKIYTLQRFLKQADISDLDGFRIKVELCSGAIKNLLATEMMVAKQEEKQYSIWHFRYSNNAQNLAQQTLKLIDDYQGSKELVPSGSTVAIGPKLVILVAMIILSQFR